jgi:multidrug efflux pump subunit AcrB
MNQVVAFALRRRALVLLLMVAVFVAGIAAFLKLNI